MNLLRAEQMHKMTTISLKIVEVVILSENTGHFISCSACNNSYIFYSQLEISRLLNGQQPKTNTDGKSYFWDVDHCAYAKKQASSTNA